MPKSGLQAAPDHVLPNRGANRQGRPLREAPDNRESPSLEGTVGLDEANDGRQPDQHYESPKHDLDIAGPETQ